LLAATLYQGKTDRNQNLSGERTANSIIAKVNSCFRFMYVKANCMSAETRRTLSLALIQCHFDYSCYSWYGGISQTLKNKS
jgi:hypothetical protein